MSTSTSSYERQGTSASQPKAQTPTQDMQPLDDIMDYVTTYARQNPGTAAAWCFGIGFIVGWKLKPW